MTDNVITVTGVPDLERRIYSFSRKLGNYTVLRSLRYGAAIIKKAVSDAAPVYHPEKGHTNKWVRSGTLKAGFRVVNSKYYSIKNNRGVLGIFITLKAGTEKYKLKNDKGLKRDPKDPFYGIFVEKGVKTSRSKGFFDKGYESVKEKAGSTVISTLDTAAEAMLIQEDLHG